MPGPRSYIHRLERLGYDEYMNAENQARLASFAEVANDAGTQQPIPPPLDDPLRALENVVMTPHIAEAALRARAPSIA